MMNLFNAWNDDNDNNNNDEVVKKTLNELEDYVNKRKHEFIYIANDELSKSLDVLGEDVLKTSRVFNINMCCYAINDNCSVDGENVPFVIFLLKNMNFPAFKHECLEHPEVDDNENNKTEENSSAKQIDFETECFFKLNEFLGEERLHNAMIKTNLFHELYKGFVEDENDNHNIYAFFDVTPFHFELSSSNELCWTTMDEIIYKKKVGSRAIENNVVDFFHVNKHLRFVRDEDDEPCLLPFQFYLCKKDIHDKIVNVTKTEFAERGICMFEHDVGGFAFYFTGEPINSEIVDNLQRFVGFVKQCEYLLDDDIEHKKECFFSTVYFHNHDVIEEKEHKMQMWGVHDISNFTFIV